MGKNRISHPGIHSQIFKLLDLGAISEVPFSHDLVLSRIFNVEKSNGSDRMIIDLSNLNTEISKSTFQMEYLSKLVNLINEKDFMASIDLADALFHVSSHPSHRKYVSFA